MSSLQIQYLQPHLLGVIAYFNITLVRVDVFEDNSFSLGVLVFHFLFSCYHAAFVIIFTGFRELD